MLDLCLELDWTMQADAVEYNDDTITSDIDEDDDPLTI
jgi:hypothetical protein